MGKNKVATVEDAASCVTGFGKLKLKVALVLMAEAFGQGFWSQAETRRAIEVMVDKAQKSVVDAMLQQQGDRCCAVMACSGKLRASNREIRRCLIRV